MATYVKIHLSILLGLQHLKNKGKSQMIQLQYVKTVNTDTCVTILEKYLKRIMENIIGCRHVPLIRIKIRGIVTMDNSL